MTSPKSYDYVIVGGGSAGCVVAARLAEEKAGTVLLLECGQAATSNPETLRTDGFKEAFANDNTMWDRMSIPQAHAGKRRVYVGSGRGLGGSGSVNGMVYTRGDRRDFAQWPQNWHWQDVIPAFEALESRLHIQNRSPTQFTEAGIEAACKTGFQRKNGLNDGDLCGYIGYNDMNYEGQARRSSYTAFIHQRESELPLLTIRTECRVQRIRFDENRRATAIECCEGGRKSLVQINRELILCAGALETPKLLMLSGIGPKEELDRFSIPGVLYAPEIGKHLQDHPSVGVFFKGSKDVDFYYPQVYGFHRVNPQSGLPADQADTCFVFMSLGNLLEHTMKRMVPLMLLPDRLYKNLTLRKAVRSLVSLLLKIPLIRPFADKVYGLVVILGKPHSLGEVHLASADPADNPAVDPAYYRDPRDMQTLIAGVDVAMRIAGQGDLQNWGNRLLSRPAASGDAAKMARWIGKSTITPFHFSGTCRMGPTENTPVDLELKLRGIDNVRVADASVIPEVPVSALNAPTMMIGYRAAEFILREIRPNVCPAEETRTQSTASTATA